MLTTHTPPTYEQLRSRTDAPPGSAWFVFGERDECGTVNLQTSETILQALRCVRRGETFNLDYELAAFSPSLSPYRDTVEHRVISRNDGNVRDDYLDRFYLQSGSQIDGLRHHRHPVHGFYGGAADEEVDAGTPRLGIQGWASRGIVGRGVLLDVEGYLASVGRPLDHAAGPAITADVLIAAAAWQSVTFRPGDVLLLHTGWARHFLEDMSPDQRRELIEARRFTGLAQSQEAVEWIWDNHFSVVASDTVAVEVLPPLETSPFTQATRRMMHSDLIALLGVCLGELWKLDELASDCRRDGVHECLVMSKPLNLLGGVGSPANALALR